MTATIIPFAPRMTFDEFCAAHGFTMEIRERSIHSTLPRWYASPTVLIEIMHGGMATVTYGDGNTPDEALADYMPRLNGKELRIGGPDGPKVRAPNEWKARFRPR